MVQKMNKRNQKIIYKYFQRIEIKVMKFRSGKERADTIKCMENQLREEIEDAAQKFEIARVMVLEVGGLKMDEAIVIPTK